ncbi:GTPase-associated system all-helical protein GASH [Azonexus sp. R2A61]|uniref:GTPase-associated system all-helical protein GASH n=1 Tax=Azonexus sp. R2A61 TaxID=2744443 RepID=UPI001F3FD720|nr:GTPase-associated system all-helical protein GASH [Azonexus sp. R2A61]
MNDVASLVRIFNPSPDDDYVDKRTKAIADLAEKFRASRVPKKFWEYADGIATALSTGTMPDALAEMVESSIKEFSSSFTRNDNELQMLVCALAAAYNVLSECKPSSNGYTSAEIFTVTLLSALSGPMTVLAPKLEECKNALIEAADAAVAAAADKQRERKAVPDFDVALEEGEATSELAKKINAALNKVLQPLRSNAILDREELNLLWWAIGDWSTIGNSRISSMSTAQALLLSSFETANRLRRIPATAHVYVALAKIRANEEVGFSELRNAAFEYRTQLEEHDKKFVEALKYPRAFPLLCGLFDNVDTPFSEQQLPAIEWAKRLMVEIGTVRLTNSHSV